MHCPLSFFLVPKMHKTKAHVFFVHFSSTCRTKQNEYLDAVVAPSGFKFSQSKMMENENLAKTTPYLL